MDNIFVMFYAHCQHGLSLSGSCDVMVDTIHYHVEDKHNFESKISLKMYVYIRIDHIDWIGEIDR
jgi:hypothetical protein